VVINIHLPVFYEGVPLMERISYEKDIFKEDTIKKRILSSFNLSPNRGDLLEEYPVTAAGTFRLGVTFDINQCATLITFVQL
jgi:hypothetical protein